MELDKVKVVHYCAAVRVQAKEENMDREDIKMLVKKWWDIYNDETLDYKRTNSISPIERETGKFTAALSEAGAVHLITSPSAA
ncbi:galactinol synthase 2 [Actinidia rufa]|uniref:Galactinol synthase 2 n=1 Tax=Actinidia rufa TaxID=165716 RepID=A0A7J0G8Y5_9ERIC|nr:galactinol synthase 2 [Actinidia rufa]